MKGVVLLLGSDLFLARLAFEEILGEHADWQVSRLRGPEVEETLGALLDDLRTPSLFAPGRVLLVEDAAGLFVEQTLTALAAYAKRPAAGALLVLQASGVDRRRKAVKQLADLCEVRSCDPPPAKQFAGWVAQHARAAHGLRADTRAVQELRRRLGDDPGRIDAALARLREQVEPRTQVRAQDVAFSTEEHRSPLIFEAANALEARELDRALAAVRGVFAEGVRVRQDVVTKREALGPMLLGNLHKNYVKLLRYHMHRRLGANERDAARDAGATPAQLPFFIQRARTHRFETLLDRHRHFIDADRALKGGESVDAQRVLERMLLQLLA